MSAFVILSSLLYYMRKDDTDLFDNIHVLNLIAASLRNGMQYLKVNHVKGSEPEMVIVSQIEVMEQMELQF